mmetsp:Transcript_15437/g.21599  ORF Transcript_15437/g.21599 Transcript_15437/m.21599 type:complete len:233 (-) Transcript_15437:111-809(-)|eukprot:jgi/Bigna1/89099/estExt_fgenesh1_pg.C_430106
MRTKKWNRSVHRGIAAYLAALAIPTLILISQPGKERGGLHGSFGNGVGDGNSNNKGAPDDCSMRGEDDVVSNTPSFGWFSGRTSPAPPSRRGGGAASDSYSAPDRGINSGSMSVNGIPKNKDLKSEVEQLRTEVSTLKASQSIETFKLIKSHQEKYEGVRKELETIRQRVDKLKEKAEPQATLIGRLFALVAWIFAIFDFLIKWSWRLLVVVLVVRWWTSIRAWPSLPWQRW